MFHDADCGVVTGSTLDEAFGGIGLLVEHSPAVTLGQEADVFYNGMRMTAVIRHIGSHGKTGFRVGLAWKGVILSQKARAAVQMRKERGLETDDIKYERFIRSIPGSTNTMWSLYESHSWTELCDSAERLGIQAREADIEDLTGYVDRLRRFVKSHESYEAVGKALNGLIDAAIDVCEDSDW